MKSNATGAGESEEPKLSFLKVACAAVNSIGDHIYFGGALIVEPRYVAELVIRAREDGLLV